MLAIADRWWVPTTRGALAIAFGLLAILWPGLVLTTMVILFGVFALTDGVVALIGLWRSRGGRQVTAGPRRAATTPWWLQLVVGAAGVVAGLATLVYPGITSLVLLSFIAAYALVIGVAQIASAIVQRKQDGALALGLSGAIATLFGLGVMFNPGIGAVAIAWLIGIFAIAMGGALIAMGLMLRNVKAAVEPRLVATMIPEEERARIEK
jgi:uncharacterized membrane protein HdeD (DUF308 family)